MSEIRDFFPIHNEETILNAAAQIYLRRMTRATTAIENPSALCEYLRARLAGYPYEVFLCLFLDARLRDTSARPVVRPTSLAEILRQKEIKVSDLIRIEKTREVKAILRQIKREQGVRWWRMENESEPANASDIPIYRRQPTWKNSPVRKVIYEKPPPGQGWKKEHWVKKEPEDLKYGDGWVPPRLIEQFHFHDQIVRIVKEMEIAEMGLSMDDGPEAIPDLIRYEVSLQWRPNQTVDTIRIRGIPYVFSFDITTPRRAIEAKKSTPELGKTKKAKNRKA